MARKGPMIVKIKYTSRIKCQRGPYILYFDFLHSWDYLYKFPANLAYYMVFPFLPDQYFVLSVEMNKLYKLQQ